MLLYDDNTLLLQTYEQSALADGVPFISWPWELRELAR
jgi:hypothetical protein